MDFSLIKESVMIHSFCIQNFCSWALLEKSCLNDKFKIVYSFFIKTFRIKSYKFCSLIFIYPCRGFFLEKSVQKYFWILNISISSIMWSMMRWIVRPMMMRWRMKPWWRRWWIVNRNVFYNNHFFAEMSLGHWHKCQGR